MDGAIVGEICHIHAASAGGPRYDPAQSAAKRHGYDNLILLCANHHTVIDSDIEAYSVERLVKMKADHEHTATTLSDQESSSGAQLLLSVNQSGGIAAQVINAQTIHVHAATAPAPAAVPVRAGMRFFDQGAVMATAGFPGEQEFRFEGERAIYLRLYGAGNQPRIGNAKLQEAFRKQQPCPMSMTIGGVAARNGHGAIIYDPASATVIGAFTQGFESGELWGMNDRLFVPHERNVFPGQPREFVYVMPMAAVEKVYVRTLDNYVKVAQVAFALTPPYTVELGAYGLDNCYLGVPGGPNNTGRLVGPIMRDAFRRTYSLDDVSEDAQRRLLKSYFDDFYDLAAVVRSDIWTDALIAANGLPSR